MARESQIPANSALWNSPSTAPGRGRAIGHQRKEVTLSGSADLVKDGRQARPDPLARLAEDLPRTDMNRLP